jgi:hypothetical protein
LTGPESARELFGAESGEGEIAFRVETPRNCKSLPEKRPFSAPAEIFEAPPLILHGPSVIARCATHIAAVAVQEHACGCECNQDE